VFVWRTFERTEVFVTDLFDLLVELAYTCIIPIEFKYYSAAD